MLVRDVMTHNVVTISSNMPILEAKRLLEFHKFERLPIVDKGKLVGLVTKDNLLKASPSPATTLSRGELHYLLSKLTVKEIIMKMRDISLFSKQDMKVFGEPKKGK